MKQLVPIYDHVLKELESKAAKWDDPQTQADLELAQAIRLAFNQYDLYDGGFFLENEAELINWYRERKKGGGNANA